MGNDRDIEPARPNMESEPPTPRGRGALNWLLLAVLALFVFEWTAHPVLAAVVLSGKFGWDYACTADWLRRVDPHAGRGWACFWFYLATGLWKVASCGFGTTAGDIHEQR